MAKTYVVDGAKLKCSCGTTTSNLKVANNHNASIGGKLQANIKDSRPNANIKSFGPCGNRPKRRTCDLKITGQWTSGKTDLNVGGAPALLNSSKLRCNRGGTISIVDPGQKLDQTGAAPVKTRKTSTKKTTETEILSVRGIVYIGPSIPGLLNRPVPTENGYFTKIDIKPKERIGQWCIIHKDKLPLTEVANRIYHDQSFTGFINDANKIDTDYAVKGQALYLPDLNYNIWKMDNGMRLASYSYTGIDFKSLKPIIQIAGDVEARYINATFEEYLFEGENCKGGIVEQQSLSYDSYRGNVKRDEKRMKLEFPSDEIGIAKDIRDAIKQGEHISSRWSKKGRYVWKISKNKGVIDRTFGWVNGRSFAKTIVKSGCKGMLISSVVFAGIDAGCDYYNNGDVNHAMYILGKETTKGIISGGAGLGASALVVVFIPGLGWAYVIGAGIVFSMGVAFGLDWLDERLQREGIIPG